MRAKGEAEKSLKNNRDLRACQNIDIFLMQKRQDWRMPSAWRLQPLTFLAGLGLDQWHEGHGPLLRPLIPMNRPHYLSAPSPSWRQYS